MNTFPSAMPEEPAVAIEQPCSEGCRYFKRLPKPAWSDFGICDNPRSDRHGYPISPGRDCRLYEPAPL